VEVDNPPGQEALRLVIVERNQLFRDCLASVLARGPQIQVVAGTESKQEVLRVLATSPVDVMLVDMDSSPEGALELVREVSGRYSRVKILILGRQGADGPILDGMGAGASGYLFRDQSLAELCSAIGAVSRGETVYGPGVVHTLFARLASLSRERWRQQKLEVLRLTSRELEILALVAEGWSNQEIAEYLFLSVHTVKNHIHKILETLGVHNRWAAVCFAQERGWLQGLRCRLASGPGEEDS
jgi:DNA-binding NarL/FixJ family response regulator